MNFKEKMWQKFAGNLCINYLWCLYEFTLDDHIRNSEGVTRWIKHKVTGSLHKLTYCKPTMWKLLLNLKIINNNYFAYHVVLVSTRQVLDPFQHAIAARTQNARSVIFLYFFTELRTYHLFYSIYKHDAIDIADPSSTQDAYRTWTS